MDQAQASDSSGRDQLWASLRALRPEIDRLAAGEVELSDFQKKLVMLVAGIVVAELDFRARDAAAE